MGESILGVAVGTGAGRLDLWIRQQSMPLCSSGVYLVFISKVSLNLKNVLLLM